MPWEEKYSMGTSPNTSENDLRQLAQDKDAHIRYNVARNSNTPLDILQDLTKDKIPGVRYNVARNPSTPFYILQDIIKDKIASVRGSVAENLNASSEMLVAILEYEKNVKEPEEDIIRFLYTHPNLPYMAKIIIETLFGEWL